MITANYQKLNSIAEKNSVIVLGGTEDSMIPVAEISQSFEFAFKLYNRSVPGLSIKEAVKAFEMNISKIQPEGLIIHLGQEDEDFFKKNPDEFDNAYMNLIAAAKKINPKIRLILVSLFNDENNLVINEINRHIKAIADSEECAFINTDNAKIWNPEATKEILAFIYSLGFESRLNIKKPLYDIAKILYSYAYENIYLAEKESQNYA